MSKPHVQGLVDCKSKFTEVSSNAFDDLLIHLHGTKTISKS